MTRYKRLGYNLGLHSPHILRELRLGKASYQEILENETFLNELFVVFQETNNFDLAYFLEKMLPGSCIHFLRDYYETWKEEGQHDPDIELISLFPNDAIYKAFLDGGLFEDPLPGHSYLAVMGYPFSKSWLIDAVVEELEDEDFYDVLPRSLQFLGYHASTIFPPAIFQKVKIVIQQLFNENPFEYAKCAHLVGLDLSQAFLREYTMRMFANMDVSLEDLVFLNNCGALTEQISSRVSLLGASFSALVDFLETSNRLESRGE